MIVEDPDEPSWNTIAEQYSTESTCNSTTSLDSTTPPYVDRTSGGLSCASPASGVLFIRNSILEESETEIREDSSEKDPLMSDTKIREYSTKKDGILAMTYIREVSSERDPLLEEEVIVVHVLETAEVCLLCCMIY